MFWSSMVIIVPAVVWILLSQLLVSHAAMLSEVKDLHDNLMKNYSRILRPIKDQSKIVQVALKLDFQTLMEFNDVGGSIHYSCFLTITWTDESITWIPGSYANISTMQILAQDVWIPRINLLYSVQDSYITNRDATDMVRYNNQGKATLRIVVLLRTLCEPDITFYPFDTQICLAFFGMPEYSSKECILSGTYSDEPHVMENSKWEIKQINLRTTSETHLALSIKMKRRSFFLVVFMILPASLLVCLNCFAFVLPSESGEKASFAVTVYLSFAVLMTVISAQLPPTSLTASVFTYMLIACLAFSTLIVICTILSIACYNRRDDISVPVYISKLIRCLHLFRNKIHSSEQKTVRQEIGDDKDKKNDAVEMLDDNISTTNCKNSNDQKYQSEINGGPMANITWRCVSIQLDKLLFVFSMVGICIAHVVVIVYVTLNTAE